MQLQFDKSELLHLETLVNRVQEQEQTQEIRLPDGMPDIGKVLGAWGQVLVRSKEWRNGGMGVSGGVMVWVLYAPDEGGTPRCLDTWIPFQMNWDFSDKGRDGVIHVSPLLKNVDARITSARKIMVRTNVALLGQAMLPASSSVAVTQDVPCDVQILKNNYPVRIPKEAGEKPFAIDETLAMPASCPKIAELIRYSLRPEVTDQKLMADKVVFRGICILHMMYRAEDDGIYSWDFEIPFSQYTELERDYEQDAFPSIMPVVTSIELTRDEDGNLQLKAGLSCQYIIYDGDMITLASDAYSPNRVVLPEIEQLQLPVVLESVKETVNAELNLQEDIARVADVAFYPDHPISAVSDDKSVTLLSGVFQILGYNSENALMSCASKWEMEWELPCDNDSKVEVTVCASGNPQAITGGDAVNLRGGILLDVKTTANQGLNMITGLDIGEQIQLDPNRPSLVLRRCTDEDLWDIAKKCGSTVEAIRKANRLENQPVSNQILIVPIL